MKKLVLILYIVILQTSTAQWQPCKNGIQTNEISCYNTEIDKTNTSKFGEVIMATDDEDYWFIKNNRLSNLRLRYLAINENNISSIPKNEHLFLSANDGVELKNIGLKNSAAKTFMAIIGNNIFLGGEGVYLSTDYGNNWTKKNSGLIYLSEPGLIINGDYIFAGTKNKGVFRAKLSDLGINAVSEETSQNNLLQVYPNPTYDFIFINCNNELINKNIKIYDILGNEVWQGIMNGESMRIDVSSFPAGVYYVKVNGEMNMFVKN
ncbi:MAG: T9SS type A sorting domain-containing protein [Bacteroidetes bacterium]|nr:T9SS type A sorting domain-containing protein [Bacteroidota bacterium]